MGEEEKEMIFFFDKIYHQGKYFPSEAIGIFNTVYGKLLAEMQAGACIFESWRQGNSRHSKLDGESYFISLLFASCVKYHITSDNGVRVNNPKVFKKTKKWQGAVEVLYSNSS